MTRPATQTLAPASWRQVHRGRLLTLVLVLALLVPLVGPAQQAIGAEQPGGGRSAQAKGTSECARFAAAGATAEIIEGDDAGELPDYCRVAGTLGKATGYEIRLPTETWNGKFYMTGCGGFCGSVSIDSCDEALTRGYAVAATDGGHQGSSGDGSWGYRDTKAEVDWAFLAVQQVANRSHRLIERFYGEEASHSYFAGCSAGGREALMAAERLPHLFDGIVAGAPANRQAYLAGVSQAWIEQAQFDDDGNRVFGVDALDTIDEAVYALCDELDGLADGIITDPESCDFDPGDLACDPGQTEGCLDDHELEALRKIYDSPRNSAGDELYPGGLPVGSEHLWPGFSVGFGENLSGGGNFAQEYLRYLAFPRDPGEDYSVFDFDFDADVAKLAPKAQLYNAVDTELTQFQQQGGKLILWHGWADPLITPHGTVAYYDDIVERAGSLEQAQDYARLFMLPGVGHCSGGPGAGQVDWLTALERWVEDDEAPEEMISKGSEGGSEFTRPVYPYPMVSAYIGGDPSSHESFGPTAP